MEHVSVLFKKTCPEEKKVKLVNGSVVLLMDSSTKEVQEVFLVTSFRNKRNNPERWDSTAQYCSLINLKNGAIAFEEPCSRITTEQRVLKHLVPEFGSRDTYNFWKQNHSDSYRVVGKTLLVVPKDQYQINVSLEVDSPC